MNIVKKYFFYKRLVRQTKEKIEASRLNIELYTILLDDTAKKKKAGEKILKKNKKAKVDMGLGKLETDHLQNQINDWKLSIESNLKMIDLIEGKTKKFILF